MPPTPPETLFQAIFEAEFDNVPGLPVGLALDSDYVYWAQGMGVIDPGVESATNVVRCAKAGCVSPETLVSGQDTARAVAVDGVAIYWTTGDGKVKKLAKPSSSVSPME